MPVLFWNRSIKPTENTETGGPVKKGITTFFVVRPISTTSGIVQESGKSHRESRVDSLLKKSDIYYRRFEELERIEAFAMILELEFELGISSQFVDIHRKVCSMWNNKINLLEIHISFYDIYIFFHP